MAQIETDADVQIVSDELPAGGYTLEELPARPGASRFALTTGPGGVDGLDERLLLCSAAEHLLQKRIAELTPPPITVKSVNTKKIAQLAEDPTTYTLVDAEIVSGPVQLEPVVSRGKFGPKGKHPAETFDAFLLGQAGWGADDPPLSDTQVYDLALAVAQQYQLDGQLLRRFNRTLTTAICARAGLAEIRLLTF